MKKYVFIRYAKFFIFSFFLLLFSCNMMKESDINAIAFPPKLSITAILDTDCLDISLMEGRSLADFAQQFFDYKIDIRNGEIRLFEDHVLILTIPGPFDMSIQKFDYQDNPRKNGYQRTFTGIVTRPGSVYRLEVDVEGFPVAASTAVMPVTPVVSASLDTSVIEVKKNVIKIGSLHQNILDSDDLLPDRYWPVSVHITDPEPGVQNYFAMDISKNEVSSNTLCWVGGIGTFDGSLLSDAGMEHLLISNAFDRADLYLFSMLPLSDVSFSGKTVSHHFYTRAVKQERMKEAVLHLEDDSDVEKITVQHSLILRVRHISLATFRYYRGIVLQQGGTGFFVEPVNVIGNIENGYGSFSVQNTTSINLLEWETYEYRKKEE